MTAIPWHHRWWDSMCRRKSKHSCIGWTTRYVTKKPLWPMNGKINSGQSYQRELYSSQGRGYWPSWYKRWKIETKLRWFLLKDKFSMNMKNNIGVWVTPIVYVIREDKPSGWDPEINAISDLGNLIYQVGLTGIEFTDIMLQYVPSCKVLALSPQHMNE